MKVRFELGIPEDAQVAIHVARVDPMKDHATFLEAMASLPRLHGVLVGSGTEALSLPPNVKALGLRRDVERFYAAADLVVSTSAFAEGFSNAIAEGMSAGLIPVVTDIGDARHIVGDAGYVVASRDAGAVIQALTHVFDLSFAERQSCASRARGRIVDHFGLARAVERYAGLYALA